MSKLIPAIILSAQTMALGVVRALGQQGVEARPSRERPDRVFV
jgi:hypothetical protein